MNSNVAVMSGFSPKGRIEYGEHFLQTFDRFWPKTISLMVFVEESTPIPRSGERSVWSCPGLREFIERHRSNPKYVGKEPLPEWRPKHRDDGYSYRHDAVRFSRQCFIPETAASEMRDGDILAWFDADVVTFDSVPDRFIEKLLKDSDICYLGRKGFHCDLGFWAMRLSESTRSFVHNLAELWRSDAIFEQKEWHSAFAFELVMQRSSLRVENLTPAGRQHVWFQSPLARYTDHLKGNLRKRLGRSPERR